MDEWDCTNSYKLASNVPKPQTRGELVFWGFNIIPALLYCHKNVLDGSTGVSQCGAVGLISERMAKGQTPISADRVGAGSTQMFIHITRNSRNFLPVLPWLLRQSIRRISSHVISIITLCSWTGSRKNVWWSWRDWTSLHAIFLSPQEVPENLLEDTHQFPGRDVIVGQKIMEPRWSTNIVLKQYHVGHCHHSGVDI